MHNGFHSGTGSFAELPFAPDIRPSTRNPGNRQRRHTDNRHHRSDQPRHLKRQARAANHAEPRRAAKKSSAAPAHR